MRLKRGRFVVCGVGVVAATFWLGQEPDHSADAAEPVGDVVTDPLPDGFDHDLMTSGITYTVVGDPTAQRSRSAYESASGGFGFLDEDASAIVIRVRFTDRSYGKVDDVDADNPKVTPYYVDREALMVVRTGVTIPVSHPPGVGDDFPEVVKGIFVAFVDVRSNEVLMAVSWSR